MVIVLGLPVKRQGDPENGWRDWSSAGGLGS